MECQDICNQVEQVEWVRPAPKYSKAKLQIDENNSITVYDKFENEHDAKLSVMLAHCKAHPEKTAREIVEFCAEYIDKVVIE